MSATARTPASLPGFQTWRQGKEKEAKDMATKLPKGGDLTPSEFQQWVGALVGAATCTAF
jgi:hypothetical protein